MTIFVKLFFPLDCRNNQIDQVYVMKAMEIQEIQD